MTLFFSKTNKPNKHNDKKKQKKETAKLHDMIEGSPFIEELRLQHPKWEKFLSHYGDEIEDFVMCQDFNDKDKFLAFFKNISNNLELQAFENEASECLQTAIKIISSDVLKRKYRQALDKILVFEKLNKESELLPTELLQSYITLKLQCLKHLYKPQAAATELLTQWFRFKFAMSKYDRYKPSSPYRIDHRLIRWFFQGTIVKLIYK